MRQIWAPWRMTYIGAVKEKSCIFCDKVEIKDDRSGLVLARTTHALVMLNKYPYNSCHLMVAPKQHTHQFSSLLSVEYMELCVALQKAVEILWKALKPGGMNVGMNLGRCAGAGIEDHLHWHLVPRWEGDTNYMPVLSDVRVMPEHLLESYDRLSPFFDEFMVEHHG